MKTRPVKLIVIVALSLLMVGTALAQEGSRPDRATPQDVPAALGEMKLDQPLQLESATLTNGLHPSLTNAVGEQEVIVSLRTPAVARQKVEGKKAEEAKKDLKGEQEALIERVKELDPDAQILAEVQVVLNAIFVQVDATILDELAEDPAVSRVVPVGNYELDLSETVPYIGASAVQAAGFDGTGVRVAVLDSGIDYTHAALGGSGDPAEYAANDPAIIEPGTFPTAKVVGGYDFVGSVWPTGALAPDPDPLDDGPQAGHGTHVAHIIGGHGGVAPGVDLYAVKVCSSVSTSCSGIALINGMEFAVDPNGDGDPEDAVDAINMSLGADYGQPFDDDLSLAVDNASALGVLTVSSAGNGADKPYVTGTPSSAPTALSVAQTQVPSAELQLITVDGVDYPAVFQPWSAPLTETLSGPVQYGDGAGGNLEGCDPFPAGSLDGMIVLVDRGTCTFTTKIFNIGNAGGIAGIIGLVAPGAPFSGGFADPGGPITIPGYMISQADANAIKAALPTDGTIDPENGIPLIGQMVGSSSRGPQHESTNLIKPEIGAPGASVSAIAGSGDGEGPFGGTSGASPMVAGSAALLLQANPGLSPVEVKARLMNNGETNIDTDPFSGLAPITRIGGGEVRVDAALEAPAAAWDTAYPSGALSFGFVDVRGKVLNLHKTVRVRNYSDKDIEYTITPTFRYPDDEANGAVSIQAPEKVYVRAGRDATFHVRLRIDGQLLRGNHMNSGNMGADPSGLTTNEYDGYLILDDGSHPIHMAWHVLPRKAADVLARPETLHFRDGIARVKMINRGVGTAQIDAYALLAVSPDLPEGGPGAQSPTPDLRAVGINTIPVPAGFCSTEASFVWTFAINTWERQQHLLPVSHQIALDVDQDGTDDYVVLNRDVSFNSVTDGRQLSWVFDLSTGDAAALFFAEHAMNTGNTVLYICGEQVGLTGTDMLSTNVDMSVFAQDFYYGGPGDGIDGLTVTPLGEQYVAVPEDLPFRTVGLMPVYDFGPFPGNSPELGVLLFTNGDRGAGNHGGATADTEALLLTAP